MFDAHRARLYWLLRWSERYTKTDMVYFITRNFWMNVNRGSSVINGLVLSVAFANLLTKEAYGTYAFTLALMGLFSMPQTTALGAGLVKAVARGQDDIVLEGLRRVFPYSVAGAVGLGTLGLYYLYMGNSVLAACFVVGALLLPLSVTNSVSKSVLSAKSEFELMARFNLWRTPLMTLLLVAVAWFTHSAMWIVIANVAGGVILGSLLYARVMRLYNIRRAAPSGAHFDSRYAFHSGLLSIFGYLSEQLDDILLWKFMGAAPVAVYTYAIAPVRELRGLIENQGAIALAKFAQKDFESVRANIMFRVRQMYIIAVPLVVAYILAAPWIFKFLFPQYLDAVLLSQVASLSLLSAPRRLLNSAISAHQRLKESYIMIVMPNLVRIALACIFIPLWGVWGAVYALLITEVVDYAVLGILMRRKKT